VRSAHADADEIRNIIEERREEGQCPPKQNRARIFTTDPQCKKVCLFNNAQCVHALQLTEKRRTCKIGQKNCSMCSKGSSVRATRYHCTFCLVPLCNIVQGEGGLSCFDAWHSVDDLAAECKVRQDNLVSSRNGKRAEKRSRQVFEGESIMNENNGDGVGGDVQSPL